MPFNRNYWRFLSAGLVGPCCWRPRSRKWATLPNVAITPRFCFKIRSSVAAVTRICWLFSNEDVCRGFERLCRFTSHIRFSRKRSAVGAGRRGPAPQRGAACDADGARHSKTNDRVLCGAAEVKLEAIDAQRSEFPVEVMCRVLDVSKSGYYAWRQRA